MDAMEAKMLEWRKKVPSKRQLTSTLGKLVQQKSVAVLYTPTEQDRIKKMTDLIAAATSEYERGEHWDRIIAVVDALSSASNRNVLRESIRFLRLRLGDPSPRVVILALTLTEAVVKNCGHLVHVEIATEPFLHELEALHKTHNGKCSRDSLEIAERILDMVQAWGEAFLPYRHDYPLFIETYHNMRKRGVQFPAQYDETKVPVLTPPTVTNATNGQRIDTSSVSSANSSSSALNGLSDAELYRVAVTVTEMFEDMLHEAQKTDSALRNDSGGVIRELALQARELVQRMERLIQTAVADDSESLGEYLAVNDSLNAALKYYDELVTRRAATTSSNQLEHDDQRNSSSNEPTDAGHHDDDDNDPFAEFVQQRTGSSRSGGMKSSYSDKQQLQQQAVASRSNQTEHDDNDDVDDDPFASFVQQRAAKILSNGSSSRTSNDALGEDKAPALPVELDLIDLWDDAVDAPESNPLAASSTSTSVVTAASVRDLWGGDDDLFAAPSSSTATHSANQTAPVASNQSSALIDDDLWGDAFSSPAAVPSAAPVATTAPSASFDPFATFQAPTTSAAVTAAHGPFATFVTPASTVAASTAVIDPFATFVTPSPTPTAPTSDPFATFVTPSVAAARASADPFDLLDFSRKTSISSPPNPFDLVSMPPTPMRSSVSSPSASPQQPQPQPLKSFNPFDF